MSAAAQPVESRERDATRGWGRLRTNTVQWSDRLARVAAVAAADRAALVAVREDALHVATSLVELTPPDWPDRLGAGVIRRLSKGGDAIALEIEGEVADHEGPFRSALLVAVRAEPPFVLALFRRSTPFASDELARHASLGALLAELYEETRGRFRATNKLERLEERMHAIDEVRPALAGAHDSAALLDQAAHAVAERFQAEATSLMLLDANGELRVRASVGLPEDVARDARRRLGEGIAGWVAARRRGVLLRGPVDDVRFRGVDPEARAALSVPLRIGDDVVGVLNVKRPRPGATFDESHLRVLEAVATDIATALRQVEAVQQLEEDRRRAVAIAEIARLAQAGDRRTAARLACEALGYRAVGVENGGRVDVLHAEPGASLEAPSVVRFETPGGTVLFAPGEGSADVAIAERVAPLLAGPPEPPKPNGEPQLVRRDVLRVFLVQEHPVMREGLRTVLERDGDMTVCGIAQTLDEAVAAVGEVHPTVIVCDLQLPGVEEVEAIRRLARAGRAPVVLFTGEATPALIVAALQAGARGYVPKRASPEELRAAVRAVADGIVAVHPDLYPTPIVHPHLDAEPEAPREPMPGGSKEALTRRELEYLRYLAEGYTNKEIARAMVLAEDTVKKGIQTLIAKLGAVDRTHAVVIALRSALIE